MHLPIIRKLTYKVVPLVAEGGVVLEAVLEDSCTIVGTSPRPLQPFAAAAKVHLDERLLAPLVRPHVGHAFSRLRRRRQRLVVRPGGHERSAQLRRQFVGDVFERFQFDHVFGDALQVFVVETVLAVDDGEHSLIQNTEERFERFR